MEKTQEEMSSLRKVRVEKDQVMRSESAERLDVELEVLVPQLLHSS